MSNRDGWTADGLRFKKNLEQLASSEVVIGYQAGQIQYTGDGEEVDLLDVAMWNEMGTVNAPSRPFMRKSFDDNKSEINRFIEEKKNDLISGVSADQILKEIGLFQKDLIQETITSGSFVPNAPSTIAKKGSSKPLIDTGLMRRAVNYVVRNKGE